MDSRALIDRYAGQLREVFAPLVPRGDAVALVDFPDSSNCGDHAVWLGEKALLSELGLTVVYECSAQTYNREEMAAKLGEGTILVHGGGDFGNRHARHHEFRLQAMKDFPRNKIVVFPLQVTDLDNDYLESTKSIAAGHADITWLARGTATQDLLARHLGGAARIVTAPDMAFMLGPQDRAGAPLYDVVWIARTDQDPANDRTEAATRLSSQAAEKFTLPPFADGIELNLVIKHRPPTILLTDWYALFFENEQNRIAMGRLGFDARSQIYFRRALHLLSLGHVVVTDRLHGHIFCLLMGIPHILLNNDSGKNWHFHENWTRDATLCRLAANPAEAWTLARNAVPKIKELKEPRAESWRW